MDTTPTATPTPTAYAPISCEFHDLLEALATRGTVVPIVFRDGAGVLQARTARIADVYSRGGEEFLRMGTGEAIRLDRLAAVDGALLADHAADAAWCAA